MSTIYVSTGTAIEKCGPSTGHSVQTVAFCVDTTTAKMFVEALAILKRVHDAKSEAGRDAFGVQNFLEHAGMI